MKGCKELQKDVCWKRGRNFSSMHAIKKQASGQLLKKVYKKGCEELRNKDCRKVAIPFSRTCNKVGMDLGKKVCKKSSKEVSKKECKR